MRLAQLIKPTERDADVGIDEIRKAAESISSDRVKGA
jgi:hypothetical protein